MSEAVDDEPQFIMSDELFERLKRAVEGPTIQLPSGVSREERREFILNRLRELDEQSTKM